LTAGLYLDKVKTTPSGDRVEPGSEGLRQSAADSLGGGCMWESQRHSSPGSVATVDKAPGQMWMEHRVDAAAVVAAAAAAVADDDDLQSKRHCQQADTCQQAMNVHRCFSMLSEYPFLLTQKDGTQSCRHDRRRHTGSLAKCHSEIR